MPSPRRHTCEAPLHMWNIPPRATSVREIPFLKRQPTRQKSHLRFNISIHSSNLRRNIAYWLFSLLLLRLLGGHLPEYSKCNKGGRKHENKFFPTIDTWLAGWLTPQQECRWLTETGKVFPVRLCRAGIRFQFFLTVQHTFGSRWVVKVVCSKGWE